MKTLFVLVLLWGHGTSWSSSHESMELCQAQKTLDVLRHKPVKAECFEFNFKK